MGNLAQDPADDARHIESAAWSRGANRRLYDTVLVPWWTVARDVERRTAQTYEQSTSWRLTAPLRWFVARFLPSRRRVAAPAREAPLVRAPEDLAHYTAWIKADEASCQAMLKPALFGRQALVPPNMAVVVHLGEAPVAAVAEMLDGVGPWLGTACELVAICREGTAGHALVGDLGAAVPGVAVVLEAAAGQAASRGAAAAATAAEYLCFFDLPDRISPGALKIIGEALAADPDAVILFGDEDTIDDEGVRRAPFFKPGWDPELQHAGNLLGPLLVVRREAVLEALAEAPDAAEDWYWATGTRIAERCRADQIVHVPAILCHRPAGAMPAGIRWRAVHEAALTQRPLVSVIIPTRDKPELLATCMNGLLRETDYPAMEVLLLDNGTTDPDALALLDGFTAEARVRVLRRPEAFNWSALNNAGARAARGDILVLLNNDIAVVDGGWLNELVGHAVRPAIGAVGAKLLFPGGAMQHAGVVIDTDGIPKHVLRCAPGDSTALGGILAVPHTVSAVTGACLAVRREVFFAVGGLDENLAVACNDADFCLRLRAHGYRNIWTPLAVLEHREVATRGHDSTKKMQERSWSELDLLCRNWGAAIFCDPYFNANLALVDEQPSLRIASEAPRHFGARMQR